MSHECANQTTKAQPSSYVDLSIIKPPPFEVPSSLTVLYSPAFPLTHLVPSRRVHIAYPKIREMIAHVDAHGIQCPVIITGKRTVNGSISYEIDLGHKRVFVAQYLKHTHIPAIVNVISPHDTDDDMTLCDYIPTHPSKPCPATVHRLRTSCDVIRVFPNLHLKHFGLDPREGVVAVGKDCYEWLVEGKKPEAAD